MIRFKTQLPTLSAARKVIGNCRLHVEPDFRQHWAVQIVLNWSYFVWCQDNLRSRRTRFQIMILGNSKPDRTDAILMLQYFQAKIIHSTRCEFQPTVSIKRDRHENPFPSYCYGITNARLR